MTGTIDRPSKKLQVFISSPFGGMEDYRRAVMEGVVRAGHVPILLENFNFSNEEDIPVIVDALKSCQVYILILGHSYGSRVDEPACERVRELCSGIDIQEGISFTELEYRLAKHFERLAETDGNDQIAIYTILFDRKQVEANRKENPKNLDATDKAKEDNAFWTFYNTVKKEGKFGKPLDETDEVTKKTLPLEINLALEKLDTANLRGWIPEPKGIPSNLIPAISQNRLTQVVIGSLGMFGALDSRITRNAELKQRACMFFWEQYGGSILDMNANLFFESGSSVAYVADAIGSEIRSGRRVASNNVLAHLLLWLYHRGRCEMFPNTAADPEDQFGATFGKHIDVLNERRSLPGRQPEPNYTLKPLNDEEKQAIEETLKEVAAPNHWTGKTLMLGAISGIQMSDSPKVNWGPGSDRSDAQERAVAKCRGFHVGSYKNKLFKRFMYETELPLMVFLDASKVDCNIEVGRCHFIFDQQKTWDNFVTSYPLAFCVGCQGEELQVRAKAFEEKGFEIVEDNSTYANRAFIARNSSFVAQFSSSLRPS